MTGPEPKRHTGALVVAGVALAVVAYSALSGRREQEASAPRSEVVGWYGAMELYRNVALWAGKRAMAAELNYWKAVRNG